MVNRRKFLSSACAAALVARSPLRDCGQQAEPVLEHSLPPTDIDFQRSKSYIEQVPVHRYHWASDRAVEAFNDIKFGLRIHWGIYSIFGKPHESWPFLPMTFEERQSYNQAYKTWNPRDFDAEGWMDLCHQAGLKMLAFTTKHHEGFSMFDTKTRVKNRINWTSSGGPRVEDCDLAYSMMETPFRRDVVQELTAAAHRRNIKVDLYFSHSDWYDADFRPYGWHPLQVQSSPEEWHWQESEMPAAEFWEQIEKRMANRLVVVPEATPEQIARMVERHRTQLTELLTRYGTIDMLCLDIFWGPKVWPQMRETILKIREIQPDVMLRARGIGNYGDYFTPEGFVPGAKQSTRMPWFVIYPLGGSFSYEPDPTKYKGTEWIIHNLVDVTAKGGNFMVGVGPNALGSFHPMAIRQLKAAGEWLKVNGEGIYGTRPRTGSMWMEGDKLRFTRSKNNSTVYCFAMEWPGETLAITSIERSQVTSVEMLGYPHKLSFHWDSTRGLVISIPDALQQASRRPGEFAWGFKVSRLG